MTLLFSQKDIDEKQRLGIFANLVNSLVDRVKNAFQKDPLHLAVRLEDLPNYQQVQKLLSFSRDDEGVKTLRLGLERADGTTKWVRLLKYASDCKNKKAAPSWWGRLIPNRKFVRSLNSIAKEEPSPFTREDLRQVLLGDEVIVLTQEHQQALDELVDFLYAQFYRFYQEIAKGVAAEGANFALNRLSTLPIILHVIADRLGFIRGFKACFKDSYTYLIGTVLDIAFAYICTRSTRLAESTYTEDFFGLSGNNIDQRTISKFADELVKLFRTGGVVVPKLDSTGKPVLTESGTPVNRLRECGSLISAIFCLFEYAMGESIRVLSTQAADAALKRTNKRDADPNNEDEMIAAYLQRPKGRGRPSKTTHQITLTIPPKPRGRKARNAVPDAWGRAEEKAKLLAGQKDIFLKELFSRPEYAQGLAPTSPSLSIMECFNLATKSTVNLQAKHDYFDPIHPADAPAKLTYSSNGPRRIIIDCTTHFSFQKHFYFSRLGKASNDKNKYKNVVKVMVGIDPVSGACPIFRAVEGSSNDQQVLRAVIDDLAVLGYTDIVIICDRGFSCEANLFQLDNLNIKFVMMTSILTNDSKDLRQDAVDDLLGNRSTYYNRERHIFIKTQQRTLDDLGFVDQEGNLLDDDGELITDAKGKPIKASTKDKFNHAVFFDPIVYFRVTSEEEDSVTRDLNDLNSGAVKWEDISPSHRALIAKEDDLYVYNHNAIDRVVAKETVKAIVTNLDVDDAIEILALYSLRWVIELLFKKVKNDLGKNDALYIQRDDTLAIRLGCLYLAAVIMRNIDHRMQKYYFAQGLAESAKSHHSRKKRYKANELVSGKKFPRLFISQGTNQESFSIDREEQREGETLRILYGIPQLNEVDCALGFRSLYRKPTAEELAKI